MNTLVTLTASTRSRRRSAAFTLPESLIATTVFTFLLLGIVGANIYCMKWCQIGQNKMLATDSARKAIGKLSDELRTCNNAIVGNVTNGVFLAHLNNELQTGNGLMIYPTSSTNSYVLYYLNPTNQSFFRFSTDVGTTALVAQSVTNTTVFLAQDCLGKVLTNNQNNRVICCSLQFYSTPPQSPAANYYQLQTSVAPRALN